MREHEFYGCCACIASAGCGLFPKLELLQSTESLVLNLYAPGDINAITPQGVPLALSISTAYPADGTVRITVNPAEPTQFSLKLRVPTWSNGTLLSVNNEKIPAQPGYVTINRMWKTGDTIQVIFDMSVRFLRPIPYGYDILMTNIAWSMITSYLCTTPSPLRPETILPYNAAPLHWLHSSAWAGMQRSPPFCSATKTAHRYTPSYPDRRVALPLCSLRSRMVHR